MKRLPVVLLMLFLVYGCTKHGPVEETTIITGKIDKISGLEVKLNRPNLYRLGAEPVIVSSAVIDQNGNFTMKVKLDAPGKFALMNGEQALLWDFVLTPGDSVNIEVTNHDQPYKVRFGGNGPSAKSNRAINDFYDNFPQDKDYFDKVTTGNFSAFESFTNDRRRREFDYFKEKVEKSDLPDVAINEIKDKINLEWAYAKVNYLLEFYYWNEKRNFSLPAGYLDFTKELGLDKLSQASLENYSGFINRLSLLYFSDWQMNNDPGRTAFKGEEYWHKFFNITKEKFSGKARDIAMAGCIRDFITEMSNMQARQLALVMIDDMKKNLTDTNYVAYINEIYKVRKSLLPGQVAPDFNAADLNGKTVTLSSLKGKVVFLDFWGTWCAPCMQELPYLIKLEEQFANKKIVFVSLALESQNRDGWKKFIAERNLGGTQIYLEGQFNNEIAKKYMIVGVPTFIIIDKEGKIVTSDAKRPSQPELADNLKQILQAD